MRRFHVYTTWPTNADLISQRPLPGMAHRLVSRQPMGAHFELAETLFTLGGDAVLLHNEQPLFPGGEHITPRRVRRIRGGESCDCWHNVSKGISHNKGARPFIGYGLYEGVGYRFWAWHAWAIRNDVILEWEPNPSSAPCVYWGRPWSKNEYRLFAAS